VIDDRDRAADMNKMPNNTDIASPISGRARITPFVNKYSNAVHTRACTRTYTRARARFPVFCDQPLFRKHRTFHGASYYSHRRYGASSLSFLPRASSHQVIDDRRASILAGGGARESEHLAADLAGSHRGRNSASHPLKDAKYACRRHARSKDKKTDQFANVTYRSAGRYIFYERLSKSLSLSLSLSLFCLALCHSWKHRTFSSKRIAMRITGFYRNAWNDHGR